MPTYAELVNGDSIEVDDIRSTAAGATSFSAGMKTNTIAEVTAAAGVTVDGLLIKDSVIQHPGVNATTTNFTITPITTDVGVWNNPVSQYAFYAQMGKLVNISFIFGGDVSNSSTVYLNFKIPVRSANIVNSQGATAAMSEDADPYPVILHVQNNSFDVRVYRQKLATWTIGKQYYIFGNFWYWAA